MTSNPPVGHQPSLSGTAQTIPSLTTLAAENPEAPPELLAALLAEKEEERKKLELAAWVQEQYTRCGNARNSFERQWFINLAFNAGKQYIAPIEVPGVGFRLTSPKAPPWRVRLVINKVRTASRVEHAKLTASRPIPTVVPATNEDEDYSAAAVGEQILKTKFATAEFSMVYRSWVWWGVVCGTSFMKAYFDPQKPDYEAKQLPPKPTFPGTDTPLPEELIDMLPGERERLETPVPAIGAICVERITPFHIYVPDLLCEDINGQPFVIQVMTKSPEWVEEKFGFKPNTDSRASATILDAATIIAKGSEEHLDTVLVKEVWIKPGGHKYFPEGGVLTVINEKVVQWKKKWPYPYPEYPYYKYDGINTGGFYSDSSIVDLIPLQKEYNKTRSQAIEIKNTMGKPKLVYQQGSLNPKMISSEPGQSIPYTAGYEKPEVMPAAEVPVSFVNEMTMLQQEFDDISGQHEVSRGDTPNSAISSGTAIAYLQEQDDAKLGPQVSSIERAIETLGRHYLTMAGTYWDDNRIINTAGKSNAYEAIHWKQGMLKGNTDVRVETGSALPFSKAAQTALVTELMQNGFLDPVAGLERLNIGGLDKILDEQLIDKRQAQRENLKMMDIPETMLQLLLEPAPDPVTGQPGYEEPDPMNPRNPMKFNGDGTPFQPQPPIPVNSWDNHEEHIYWHNHFRKSQEFELQSDLKKRAFELHVQLHTIALSAGMVNTRGQELVPGQKPPQEEMPFDENGEQDSANEDGGKSSEGSEAPAAEQQ